VQAVVGRTPASEVFRRASAAEPGAERAEIIRSIHFLVKAGLLRFPE
jgi:hypothetical protein